VSEKFGNGTLTIEINGLEKISGAYLMAASGLKDGSAQRFFTTEVARATDEYVPMQTGVLAGTAMRFIEPDAIHYVAPYAVYLYEGALMVDPKYKIGAFHDEKTGRFWSRKGVQKILDPEGRRLTYDKTAHPKAGDHWADRAWKEKGDVITQEVANFLEENIKRSLEK